MRLTGVTVLLVLSLVLYACNCHVHTSPAHHHDDDTLPPHRCIHNEIANSPKIREAQQKPALFENHEELMRKRSLLKQEATFQPMRFQFVTESIDLDDRETACYNLGDTIKVGDPISRNVVCSSTVVNNCWFTCTANALITPQKKEALVLLINKLKVEFESLLLTRRLAGNVKLPLDPCQGVPVPKSLNSTLYASKADMLVFVTMRAKQGTLGYAYHCMRETIYGRPVVGMLNINPQYIGASSGVYDTCKHELVHALAFSPFLYPYFIDAAGNRYQKVFSTETRYFRDSSGTNQQKSVSKLVTPKLTAQVREHFNCSSIDGAELEEAGSSSSAAAHFEARIFMNEVMIASNGYDMYGAGGAAFSQFTFAVLEDSGWYQIANWTKVEPLLFGRKAGCTMVNDRCEDWKTKREGHFCDKRNWSDGSSILRCNYDLTTKGSCDIVTYTANLNYYEHLSDPRQGGSQEFFDRCPLVARDSRYDCRVSTSDKKISGEVWGPGSACFSSNAVTSLTGTLNQRSIDARCFQFSCNNTRLSVKMGDTLIPCPRDQSYLRITALPDGYSGYIECPESGYDILCGVGSVAQSNEVIVTPDNSNDTSTSWWCRNLGIFCGSGNSAATHSRSLVTASAIVGGAFILAQIAA